MRKIKIGLTGLKPESLVTKATNIVEKMTDNPNFVTPTPTLAEVSQAADDLLTAINAASNGDRFAILERNTKEGIMKQMIRDLAAYVSGVGSGDGDIIASSGFELQRLPEPSGPVTQPVDFVAMRDVHPGSVKLNWRAVRGARVYIVEVTTTDPANDNPNWIQALMTSKSRAVIDNLNIGTYYWYRVKAVGSSNMSIWSDVSLVWAA